MLQELILLIRENKQARLALLGVGGVLAFIAIVLLVMSLLRPNYPQYQLGRTELNQQSHFGQLIGSKIYGFNGVSFFAADPKSDAKATILNRPGRLPVPSAIYWADSQGALISFKDSFSQTRVEQALSQQGLRPNETTQQYTWYLNFSNNTLQVAYPGAIRSGLAVYSSADKGFYFIPELASQGNVEGDDPLRPSSDIDSQIPLYFFNTDTRKVSNISNDIALMSVTYMAGCDFKDQRICVIGRTEQEPQKQVLYGINTQGKTTKLLESAGRMIPTNRQDTYITAEPQAQQNQQEERETVDFEPSPAVSRNVVNDSRIDLGFTVGGGNIFPYINGDTFYVVDSTIEINRSFGGYHSGKITDQRAGSQELALMLNNEPLETSFTGVVSYGDDGLTLLTDSKGAQLLVYPKGTTLHLANLTGQPKVVSSLPVNEADFSIRAEYVGSTLYVVITPNVIAKNLTEEEYTRDYGKYYQAGRSYLSKRGYAVNSSEYKVIGDQEFRKIPK
jgi:hypothetical protein